MTTLSITALVAASALYLLTACGVYRIIGPRWRAVIGAAVWPLTLGAFLWFVIITDGDHRAR